MTSVKEIRDQYATFREQCRGVRETGTPGERLALLQRVGRFYQELATIRGSDPKTAKQVKRTASMLRNLLPRQMGYDPRTIDHQSIFGSETHDPRRFSQAGARSYQSLMERSAELRKRMKDTSSLEVYQDALDFKEELSDELDYGVGGERQKKRVRQILTNLKHNKIPHYEMALGAPLERRLEEDFLERFGPREQRVVELIDQGQARQYYQGWCGRGDAVDREDFAFLVQGESLVDNYVRIKGRADEVVFYFIDESVDFIEEGIPKKAILPALQYHFFEPAISMVPRLAVEVLSDLFVYLRGEEFRERTRYKSVSLNLPGKATKELIRCLAAQPMRLMKKGSGRTLAKFGVNLLPPYDRPLVVEGVPMRSKVDFRIQK